ncbi:diacylglycerol kinase family protein [Patescibacteria group bacterium]|nr:diacylglycerol kinase family protein [Patescibacteria group bacterium]
MNKNKRFYKLLKKFGYASNGIKLAVTRHTSFVTHIIISFLVCFLAIYFRINSIELMFVISAIFIVLITELINTAIEESINGYTKEFKRGFMISKDSAAGAVLLAVFYSIIIGIIVFGPKFYILFFK